MNTSKQVNVMIGLLFVGALATLLYFLWDSEREGSALERQMEENAERGGFLFSRNCSSCHGLTGKGIEERGGLPGAILNVEDNRPTAPGDLKTKQDRFRDTIRCGRVGTLMPSWSQAQGGPLNDFQIEQLVTLITGTFPGEDPLGNPHAISEAGWENALETVNHDSEFDPPKDLTTALGPDDTALFLNNPYGMKAKDVIRVDDDPTDELYELLVVVDAPASSTLSAKISAGDNELPVEDPSVFRIGDVLLIQDEKVEVEDAPTATELVSNIGASDTTLEVKDATGLAAGGIVSVGPEKMRVRAISGATLTVERAVEETKAADHVAETPVVEAGDTINVVRGVDGTKAANHNVKVELLEVGDRIEVERGTEGTDAADHEAGAEVFRGPTPPGTTITGESGTPPCGQLAAGPAATPGPPVSVTGTVSMSMGDNFFDLNGQRNPTLSVRSGDPITVQLANAGTQVHNMVIAGVDGEFGTGDDIISDPAAISGGASGTLALTIAQPDTYLYHCDFHPGQMNGEITVTQ